MPAANKPSLDTLGEIFRFAVRRFRAARLAYGHGTANAHDEAAFLVLEALRLPIDRLEPYFDLRPSTAERARLLTLIDARVSLRDGRLHRGDDPIGAAVDGPDGAQRRVHHEQVTGRDAEATQVSGEVLDGPPIWLHGT